MKKIEFNYYDEDEFARFLFSLPEKERVKMVETIEKIEEFGFYISSRQEWTKKFNGYINLLEIRSKFSSNIIRAPYFHSSNGKYVITHGFRKKSEKTPEKEIEKEIEKALLRRKIYEEKHGVN